jgi:DNA-binding transcriptional ArsR family regulator
LAPEEDALAQETRRRIYDHVVAHPGQHLRELQRQLGMAGGTLEYHLRVLVKEGLLAQRRQGRYVRYFAASGLGRREKDAMAVLRQVVPRRVCALLVERPGQSHGELLAQFQLAPSTLTFHVKKLTAAELVEARREGRETRYWLREPAFVAGLLRKYQASFLDEVVDRVAEAFLDLGASLEPAPGEGADERESSEQEGDAGADPGPPVGDGGGDGPGPR